MACGPHADPLNGKRIEVFQRHVTPVNALSLQTGIFESGQLLILSSALVWLGCFSSYMHARWSPDVEKVEVEEEESQENEVDQHTAHMQKQNELDEDVRIEEQNATVPKNDNESENAQIMLVKMEDDKSKEPRWRRMRSKRVRGFLAKRMTMSKLCFCTLYICRRRPRYGPTFYVFLQ